MQPTQSPSALSEQSCFAESQRLLLTKLLRMLWAADTSRYTAASCLRGNAAVGLSAVYRERTRRPHRPFHRHALRLAAPPCGWAAPCFEAALSGGPSLRARRSSQRCCSALGGCLLCRGPSGLCLVVVLLVLARAAVQPGAASDNGRAGLAGLWCGESIGVRTRCALSPLHLSLAVGAPPSRKVAMPLRCA